MSSFPAQPQRGPSSARQSGAQTTSAPDGHSTRVDVINTAGGRILCVADVRGALSTLNSLAAEHGAVAIIHSGDFGFYEPSSLGQISDRTLRHLVQYSSLIPSGFQSQLLASSTSSQQMRDLLANPPPGCYPAGAPNFGLSEFPRLLTGELKLNVPVYTVWGACEDVAVLEKLRLAAVSAISVPENPKVNSTARTVAQGASRSNYSIPNLTVLDEATTRVLLIGGVRLRLFGLGGAVVSHKLFDNGTGTATIAGGGGTMWTTMLQIGELVDTAQKVYDPAETRLLVTHAAPGREGLIAQLGLVLKADLSVSAGLHFRYGGSYNEFSVHLDPEAYVTKLEQAKKSFNEVWDAVKSQVEGVVDENQQLLLNNALAVANRVPTPPVGAQAAGFEESSWKNCWNWNLPDAAFGSLVLDVRDGRVGAETKSQGFNFAYRQNQARPNDVAPSAPVPTPAAAQTPAIVAAAPSPASVPTGPAAGAKPPFAGAPGSHHRVPSSGPNNRGAFGGVGPRGSAHSHHIRGGNQPQAGPATNGPNGPGARGGFRGGNNWTPAPQGGHSSGGEGKPQHNNSRKPSAHTASEGEKTDKAEPSSDAVKTPVAETPSAVEAIKADAIDVPSRPGSASHTRQPRGPRPNKEVTASNGEQTAGESSAGESAQLSGGAEGRGRGRGGKGGRGGRGGGENGRGRGRGRGGKGEGAPQDGAEGGAAGGGEPAAPAPSAPAAGGEGGGESRKAGANGGKW